MVRRVQERVREKMETKGDWPRTFVASAARSESGEVRRGR